MHDGSADFENLAGAREPNVHAHFLFSFRKQSWNRNLISIHDQSTGETC